MARDELATVARRGGAALRSPLDIPRLAPQMKKLVKGTILDVANPIRQASFVARSRREVGWLQWIRAEPDGQPCRGRDPVPLLPLRPPGRSEHRPLAGRSDGSATDRRGLPSLRRRP